MRQPLAWCGSLAVAVPLLITIAAVLAWGTIYETRFGTAAVQRFIYQAWWFQGVLGFLAVNLAVAAFSRWPWRRQHTPFLLAHLGIILILLGGIIGSRFGVDGQMVIAEGETQQTLLLPNSVLMVHQPDQGVHQIIPTHFETQAWVREPHAVFPVTLGNRQVRLTVDRYYPNVIVDEEITGGGTSDNPAVQLRLTHDEQQEDLWLLARDPERFGLGWGDAHVVFVEAQTAAQLDQLLGRAAVDRHSRGTITIKLPHMDQPREVSVPEPGQAVELKGTPYRITFKDYFPDFTMTEQGLTSRSEEPRNPAVSFVLSGPEGDDAYLLFALHPDFQAMHGFAHKITAEVGYTHTASRVLPPKSIALVRAPSGALLAVFTGEDKERQIIDPAVIGTAYTHPQLGYQVTVTAYHPQALVDQHISNRSDDVKAEALHVVAEEGIETAQAWVGRGGTAELALGKEPVLVEYRSAEQQMAFAVKLLDFRKIDYPGTSMAAAFESDVELTDTERGLVLKKRTIKMNNPLRHRGFHLYQSSFIEGPTETTVLSVRNDPGTPCVYAGFLIVMAGVVSLFVLRTPAAIARSRKVRHTTKERRRT